MRSSLYTNIVLTVIGVCLVLVVMLDIRFLLDTKLNDKATWECVNSFANWFSAFGTIAAVWTALHLARRDRQIRLQVYAGHRHIVAPGTDRHLSEHLDVGITNIGYREAQIVNIGWKVGFLRKKYGIQSVIADGISGKIPVRLRDGEETRYLFPMSGDPQWFQDFVRMFLQPHPRIRVHFVWIQAYTSVGTLFESRIEKGLRKKLLEAALRLADYKKEN